MKKLFWRYHVNNSLHQVAALVMTEYQQEQKHKITPSLHVIPHDRKSVASHSWNFYLMQTFAQVTRGGHARS